MEALGQKQESIIIKQYRKESEKNAIHEYDILNILEGKFIAKTIGFMKKNNVPVGILLEYYENGDIRTLIERGGVRLGMKLKWMYQIASGLRNIHSSNIVHGDIKCSNILLDNDYNIKICDFHGSVHVSKSANETLKTYSYFMAPVEVILDKEATFKSSQIYIH